MHIDALSLKANFRPALPYSPSLPLHPNWPIRIYCKSCFKYLIVYAALCMNTRYWSLLYIVFFQVYPEDKQLEWNVGWISMEIRKADNDDNVDYFYHRLHSCRMSLLIP